MKPIIQLVSEIKFSSRDGTDPGGCHKMYEEIAETIMKLPDHFDNRKITFHCLPGALESAWSKCLLLLFDERPNLIFKEIKLTDLERESPKFLKLFMKKCQRL